MGVPLGYGVGCAGCLRERQVWLRALSKWAQCALRTCGRQDLKQRISLHPTGVHTLKAPGCQTALPAFQSDQDRFQPLRPLDASTVFSPEFLTITTSPIIELS